MGSKFRGADDYKTMRNAVRRWEQSLPQKERSARLSEMIRFFLPDFDIGAEAGPILDELIEKRNEFTHELIKMEGRNPIQPPSDDRVQMYYDVVGEYVLQMVENFVCHIEGVKNNAPNLDGGGVSPSLE